MPRGPSDRALRSAVAMLAERAPEDIDAVLDALEPRHRAVVSGLIGSYGGAVAPAADGRAWPAWIVERLGGGESDGVMTPHARAALAEAVRTADEAETAAPPRVTLVQGLGAMLRRRGRR